MDEFFGSRVWSASGLGDHCKHEFTNDQKKIAILAYFAASGIPRSRTLPGRRSRT